MISSASLLSQQSLAIVSNNRHSQSINSESNGYKITCTYICIFSLVFVLTKRVQISRQSINFNVWIHIEGRGIRDILSVLVDFMQFMCYCYWLCSICCNNCKIGNGESSWMSCDGCVLLWMDRPSVDAKYRALLRRWNESAFSHFAFIAGVCSRTTFNFAID